VARIIDRATEESPHNEVAFNINAQNALYLVRQRWDELVAAGRTSKTRFQNAAFNAVGRKEDEASEHELEDQVQRLEQQKRDLKLMLQAAGGDDLLKERLSRVENDIKKTNGKLDALALDVRFLVARALCDRLEVAPWGVSPNGERHTSFTTTTLVSFLAAITSINSGIETRFGPADWSRDSTDEVPLVEADEISKSYSVFNLTPSPLTSFQGKPAVKDSPTGRTKKCST
jgi:hypothetical protein